MMRTTTNLWIICLIFLGVFTSACDNTSEETAPIQVEANFTYTIDGMTATFQNTSENGESFAWEFGDGNSSTEENPTHTYATADDFSVSLTVSNGDQNDQKSETITIESPSNALLELLTGTDSKTWVLATEENAINFGPKDDPNTTWWGNSADVPEQRPCMWNNEFTFAMSGDYNRNVNGDIWKEWKVFDADNGEGCAAVSEEAVNKFGVNVDNWKDGDFSFEVVIEDGVNYLLVQGNGGYVGHYTAGVETSNYQPNDAYKYEIVSLSNERLELSAYGWGGDSNEIDGWNENQADRLVRLVLVPNN